MTLKMHVRQTQMGFLQHRVGSGGVRVPKWTPPTPEDSSISSPGTPVQSTCPTFSMTLRADASPSHTTCWFVCLNKLFRAVPSFLNFKKTFILYWSIAN